MRKCYARFGIGGGEGNLIVDHTGNWNRNVAQMGQTQPRQLEGYCGS